MMKNEQFEKLIKMSYLKDYVYNGNYSDVTLSEKMEEAEKQFNDDVNSLKTEKEFLVVAYCHRIGANEGFTVGVQLRIPGYERGHILNDSENIIDMYHFTLSFGQTDSDLAVGYLKYLGEQLITGCTVESFT